MKLPSILHTISDDLQKQHAKVIVVGGSVRDYFLELPIKDYDLEVYGLDRVETLEKVLAKYGKVKLVGKSFGVLKFVYQGEEYDFAFPRTERKTGSGHRGFAVTVDGTMDFQSAARRRDFTINAMGYDIAEKRFLDPFGGRKDLEENILRHIDDSTFTEDPLRLYRGVQFCARFGLSMHASTKRLCQEMVKEEMLEELPKERIFDEIKKLLLQAKRPSVGFVLIKELGALRYFPVLNTLHETLWQQTLQRLDIMAELKNERIERALVLMLSALVYSFESEEEVRALIGWLSDEVKLITSVVVLWHYSRRVLEIAGSEDIDTAVRKLSVHADISELVLVAKAAYRAETGRDFEAAERIVKRAEMLGVLHSAPKPLLQGRDLLQLPGFSPSPKFKEILDKVYEAQLQGRIKTKEEALVFIEKGVYLK